MFRQALRYALPGSDKRGGSQSLRLFRTKQPLQAPRLGRSHLAHGTNMLVSSLRGVSVGQGIDTAGGSGRLFAARTLRSRFG
jgi:hypothetical protein